jgi:subtilase family serine protease
MRSAKVLCALASIWNALSLRFSRFTFRMAMISRILRAIAPAIVASAAVSLFTPIPLVAQAQAQSSLVTTRLTQPIDESSLVTLKGTVHPLANAANDRGAAPDSMQLDRIQIVLKRSATQETALQQLIHDEHTPGTANYHKWLTPTQFGQQFGPSDQDVATLEAWLESKGFNVEKVNAGKQTLEISGNVAQFRTAFHTQIHKYMVNGEAHYANATNPQIPTALAPVLGGFSSLNNFPLKSYVHKLGHAVYDVKTGRAQPEWTIPSGYPLGEDFALSPGDFAVQYDLPSSTSGIDGTGQTIAIVNESNINIALVNQFRALFGLPVNPPQIIIDGNDPGIDGINNPDGPNGASTEAYLDVEWAGAVAPKATVDLVIGADTALESGLILALEHAIYGNIAPVLSLSFGACEQSLGSSNVFLNDLWEQAAAEGITVTVSTGDSGSASCDDPDSQAFAVNGLAISGFASTPYNVAVGGTDFYYSDFNQGSTAIQNQVATYWNTTTSATPTVSIKGVIPEQPWNDSQFGSNIYSYFDLFGNTTIAGGGGGPSTCVTGTAASNGSYSACSAGYAKPTWQTGSGVPSDKVRDIPDVSLFAADGSANGSYYPICATDGDCQAASGGNTVQIFAVGGTSASTPAFAGIMALVNQEYGRQGQADFVLYPLAKQFPAAFHDVTVGTNAEPCAEGTANCNNVSNPLTGSDDVNGTAVEGELSGYAATAGYDTATGLGSVDANVLLSDWNKVTFTGTTTTLTPSEASFTHGTAISISGTVSGTNPGGSVALMTDSTEPGSQAPGVTLVYNGSQSVFPVSSGSFGPSSVNYLPGGTYNIWGQYSGDGTNAASTSQKTQITVSPENSGIAFNVFTPAGYISAGASLGNVDYGTQVIASAMVAPTAEVTAFQTCHLNSGTCPVFTIPTGTVTFSDNSGVVNTAVLNDESDAEYNAPWAIGSHSITASYSGDNSYNKSTASAITFTVVKDTPEFAVSASNETQNGQFVAGQATVLNIQVANGAMIQNGNPNEGTVYPVPIAAPTGNVTVTGFPSGVPTTATLHAAVDPSYQATESVATITVPSSVAAGNYNITASYSGDSNYNSGSVNTTVQIASFSGLSSTTTATASAAATSPIAAITVTGTVTGKSGNPAPTGDIIIFSSGYGFTEYPIYPGTGDSSTFAFTLNSQSLFQGANFVTLQYTGDSTYLPSAFTLNSGNPISNPLSDFSMVPNTTIVPVAAGSSAPDTIQLASVNGFTGTVTYTCTSVTGITCTLSPTSNNFTSGGSTTMTATINAGSSVADGNYDVLITGTGPGGLFIHTLGIQAVVTSSSSGSPTFALANNGATPASVTAGSSITSTITATPANAFTGTVALTCAVTGPSGGTSVPTCSFSSSSVDITGTAAVTSTLTVNTTSSTTGGSYTATVTGTSGSLTETTAVNFTVTASASAGFTLSNSGAITISSPGATTNNTSTLTVTPSGGFTGSVNFNCSITTSPSGATDIPTCAAPAASVTGTQAATSTLTVTTTAATSSAVRHPLDKFFAAGGGVVVAALLFFGIPARRRSWRALFAILLFAGIAGIGIGCGSGGSGGGGGGGNTGTTTGSYVATVTATDAATGKITQTATVNITVN